MLHSVRRPISDLTSKQERCPNHTQPLSNSDPSPRKECFDMGSWYLDRSWRSHGTETIPKYQFLWNKAFFKTKARTRVGHIREGPEWWAPKNTNLARLESTKVFTAKQLLEHFAEVIPCYCPCPSYGNFHKKKGFPTSEVTCEGSFFW